jgi:hypothetical protein
MKDGDVILIADIFHKSLAGKVIWSLYKKTIYHVQIYVGGYFYEAAKSWGVNGVVRSKRSWCIEQAEKSEDYVVYIMRTDQKINPRLLKEFCEAEFKNKTRYNVLLLLLMPFFIATKNLWRKIPFEKQIAKLGFKCSSFADHAFLNSGIDLIEDRSEWITTPWDFFDNMNVVSVV